MSTTTNEQKKTTLQKSKSIKSAVDLLRETRKRVTGAGSTLKRSSNVTLSRTSIQNLNYHSLASVELPREPAILVIGDQGCGKSSLIRRILQNDVLPTNPRASKYPSVPVIIRLQPSSEKDPDLFFEFNHSPRIYTSAEKVAEEIESLQFSRAQARIELKVYMRKTPNFTIIDTPGLINISLDSETQKNNFENIQKTLFGLSEEFDCSYLAVSAANIDIANSGSLNMAKKLDPKGQRTISVLTKIDLMDKGTDCVDVLLNKIYHLELGNFGIISPSQNQLQTKISHKDFNDFETDFFSKMAKYSVIKENIGYNNTYRACQNLFSQQFSRFIEYLVKILSDLKNELMNKESQLAMSSKYSEFDEADNDDDPSHASDKELKKVLELSTAIAEELKLVFDWLSVNKIQAKSQKKRSSKLSLEFSPLIDCMKVITNVLPHLISRKSKSMNEIIDMYSKYTDHSFYTQYSTNVSLKILHDCLIDHLDIYLSTVDTFEKLFIKKVSAECQELCSNVPKLGDYIMDSCIRLIKNSVDDSKKLINIIFESLFVFYDPTEDAINLATQLCTLLKTHGIENLIASENSKQKHKDGNNDSQNSESRYINGLLKNPNIRQMLYNNDLQSDAIMYNSLLTFFSLQHYSDHMTLSVQNTIAHKILNSFYNGCSTAINVSIVEAFSRDELSEVLLSQNSTDFDELIKCQNEIQDISDIIDSAYSIDKR